MENVLTILRFESKQKIKKRMDKILPAAEKIHLQTLDANIGLDMFQVGAIQKTDIVREELTRAARVMARTENEAKIFSGQVKRLAEWAVERAQRKQAERERESVVIDFIVITFTNGRQTEEGERQETSIEIEQSGRRADR